MKRRQLIVLGLIVLWIASCHKNPSKPETPQDILDKLMALSGQGVAVTEITAVEGFLRSFKLEVEQPIDHHNPGGATFIQTCYLHHVDENSPMVFAPSGYIQRASSIQDVARIIQGNQLGVTHRFFDGARPSVMNWQDLTVEQAAADHHRIVTLLKPIYAGVWISSGASKSGGACLLHRRFYPDDVSGTIAKVTPFVQGTRDSRFIDFLGNVGTQTCRDRLKAVQIKMLRDREVFLPLFEGYYAERGLTLGVDSGVAFEYAVLEYSFIFWQYTHLTEAAIPDTSIEASQLFAHFCSIAGMSSFTDATIETYAPYAYQALTELGYPGYQIAHLQPWLVSVPDPDYTEFAPEGTPLVFRDEVIADLVTWLQTQGNNVIYLYGSRDPWTAAAIEGIEGTNALKIVQEGGNHGLAISTLDRQAEVLAVLETWQVLDTAVGGAQIVATNEEAVDKHLWGQ